MTFRNDLLRIHEIWDKVLGSVSVTQTVSLNENKVDVSKHVSVGGRRGWP